MGYYATFVPISDEERILFLEEMYAKHEPSAMSVDEILRIDKDFREDMGKPWARGMENLHEHKRCSQEYIDFFYRMQDTAAFVYYVKVPPHNGIYSSLGGTIYPHRTAPETLQRLLLEMTISRDVGDFLYYLTQILQSIAIQYPETLDALFPKETARQKKLPAELVDTFSQQGLAFVVEKLNSRLGIGYDTNNADYRDALEVIEVRNIIAHHTGRVSGRYIRKTGRTNIEKGQLYPLSVEYAINAGRKLTAAAHALDSTLASKFEVAV